MMKRDEMLCNNKERFERKFSCIFITNVQQSGASPNFSYHNNVNFAIQICHNAFVKWSPTRTTWQTSR